MNDYLVCAVGDWNRQLFKENKQHINGNWSYASSETELFLLLESGLKPRYIFFPHWRWIVPESILNTYECVCFHMTDVPYGRGGSPLQNLIIRGHSDTVLTALKMEKGLDTGPVYDKKQLSLSGRAEDIYLRASELAWDIIAEIVTNEPEPKVQTGEVVTFRRRTPEQSLLPEGENLEQIYNFIRMLDAPGYPKAFIETSDYRFELENAVLSDDELTAKVKIRIKK